MKIAHGVNLLLKGTPFIQYGDEINLEDTTPRYMKWNDKLNCGFSNNQTSLIEQIKCSPNVEEETSHGAGNRLIRLYQSLKDLRRKNSFLFGDVILPDSSLVQIDENLLAFVREAEKFDGYLIAANIGKSSKKFDFKNMFKLTDYKETGKSIQLPDTAKVVYFDWVGTKKHNDFEIENKIQTDRIYLNPGEFLVLSFTR
jgi:glycosidase